VTDDASAADAFFAERGFQLFVVKCSADPVAIRERSDP
jgi:hypothetical protein